MIENKDIAPGAVTEPKLSKNLRIKLTNLEKGASAQLPIVQSDGSMAYKAIGGDATLADDGTLTVTTSTTTTGETVQGPAGPAGAAGPTGATGAQGATGPAGSDANVTAENVDGALGFTGSTAGLVKRTADNAFELDTATYSTTSHTHAHADLTSVSANQHIDWTAASAGTIHATNYTDTTYSVGDGGLTQKNFTTADKTKLDTFKGKYTATLTGDDSTTIFYVTHNLGTYHVVVSVRHPIPTGSESASSIDEMFDYDHYTLMDVGYSLSSGVEVATINGAGNPCEDCIAIRFPDAPADGDDYLVTIIG